jgi:triacylglycerol lipase
LDTLGKDRLPTLNTLLEKLPIGGGDGKAFEGLTLEAMARFNEETPDIEGVKYFSWGAKFDPSLLDTFK